MSTAAVIPDQEIETVQHPTLGPLKFPKSMPYEERNAAIERMEQTKAQAPGFASSLRSSIGNVAKSQWESAKHGGGVIGQESHGPTESFNPFRPIDTAGYLVPQPVKDIFNPREGQSRAGAIGTATGEALPYLTAPLGVIEHPGKTLGAPVRGVARIGNAALANPTVKATAPYAGMFGGYLAGETIGHPWLGMGAGGTLGRAIQSGKIKFPGENLGLPHEGPNFTRAEELIRNKPAAPIGVGRSTVGPATLPPVGVPAKGGPIHDRVAAPAETATPPTIAKPTVSIPDQIATAKWFGFKNLGQAIEKFGYEGWQKLIGGQSASPTAEIGPIGKPTPFSTEGGFQPRQSLSDIRRLRDIQDDAALKQELEGELGTRAQVTGRKGGGVSLFPHESTSLQGEGRLVDLERGRDIAALNSVDATKGALQANIGGTAAPLTAADVQAARPLPGADVAANRLVGHPISPKVRPKPSVQRKAVQSER